jgi:hypothetical protein
MRIIVAFVIVILFQFSGIAQQKNTYIVKAGESPADVLPADAIYAFPVFKDGIVNMRDGSSSRQKLNYYVILNEMHFIGTYGDTLAIADPNLIKSITVDTVVYYYDKTFLQVLLQVDSFKLAVKQILLESSYRTRGGYDVPTAISSITTYGSLNKGGSMRQLQLKKDVQFSKETSYFVSDKFNHFFRADRKAFLELFSNKRTMILQFIKENKISFFKESDLKKLLQFCVSQISLSS